TVREAHFRNHQGTAATDSNACIRVPDMRRGSAFPVPCSRARQCAPSVPGARIRRRETSRTECAFSRMSCNLLEKVQRSRGFSGPASFRGRIYRPLLSQETDARAVEAADSTTTVAGDGAWNANASARTKRPSAFLNRHGSL